MNTCPQPLLRRLLAAALTTAPLCALIPSTAQTQEVQNQGAPAQSTSAAPSSPAPRPPAPRPPPITVAAAQTAVDLAFEHAPAGVSVEQFVMAIYRLNPQAFSEGRIDRLVAGASLQLPTATQAQSIGPQQARLQLQALRQAAAVAPTVPIAPGSPVPPSGSAAGSASPPAQGTASATTESGSSPAGAEAGPAGAAPAADAAPAQAPAEAASAPATSPLPAKPPVVDPLMLIGVGAALLTLLWLVLKPADPPRRRTATPKASPQASERSDPTEASMRPPMAQSGPTPAFKSLSDFGPLPSLDLGDPAHRTSSPEAPASQAGGHEPNPPESRSS